MALLSDFFISDPFQAAHYAQDDSQFPDKLEFTNITILEVSTLWEALNGGGWEELMDSIKAVLEESQGGPWIYEMPAEFLKALTSADSDTLRAANAAWAETDEMACDPSECWPIVEGLAGLASRAGSAGRRVYLYNSL